MCYDISQGHGAGIYTDIYFKGTEFGGGGGTKFGNFSKFNSVDTKNWCPLNFRGFLMNWIYLSETLLEPTAHFLDGQKRRKREEGFWFGVDFTHFCLSVFYVTLFLENHSIFSHEILHSCSWYNNALGLLGAILGYLGGLFWHMYLFFLISVQYFVMKCFSGVLAKTLIIANTRFWYHVTIFRGLF